jgi:hypothetical protein
MYHYPAEFHSEPEADPETLANLGPLTPMAGIWTSDAGLDVNPKRDGLGHQIFSERYELQPIEAQTNGLQLFYGLRYHTRVVTAGNPETTTRLGTGCGSRRQARYCSPCRYLGVRPRWPSARRPPTKSFTLEAVRGSLTNGIVSNPFLDEAFRTERYTIRVAMHADGTWSYEQDTLLIIPGRSEPFHHADQNRLRKIAEPTPNPIALIARQMTR